MTKYSYEWTKQHEMQHKGYQLLEEKKFDEAEKLLLKALEADDDNPIDRHFIYNNLIKLYYKQRNERTDAIEKCIYFCKEDIERLPEFFHHWNIQYPPAPDLPKEASLPQCPSIDRLVIIYEKDKEYQKAIDLCKYAIELGLEVTWDLYNARCGTNKGYKARIQRLEKAQKKS